MTMNLLTAAECGEYRRSVDACAEALYPNTTYDTALPQSWVDQCYDRGFDPRGHVVWGYPAEYRFGVPLPITAEGALGLARLTLGLR